VPPSGSSPSPSIHVPCPNGAPPTPCSSQHHHLPHSAALVPRRQRVLCLCAVSASSVPVPSSFSHGGDSEIPMRAPLTPRLVEEAASYKRLWPSIIRQRISVLAPRTQLALVCRHRFRPFNERASGV
jgi:hypothetical protein